MSVSALRDTFCWEINLQFKYLKSLPNQFTNLLSICHCSSTISPLGNQFAMRKSLRLIMLSIVLLTSLITVSAVFFCSIMTVRVSSQFEALRKRFYKKEYKLKFWRQLKRRIKKSESNTVWEECLKTSHVFSEH